MGEKVRFDVLRHGKDEFYVCILKAKVLKEVTYVAARGISEEEGAVQRILNKKRISKIRDFILGGGFFPTNVILNWVTKEKFVVKDGYLELETDGRYAQIIDGQHRVEGIKAAIKDNPDMETLNVPVLIALNLKTDVCAEIFLSINTEQKTVPRSLIYDLYGLTSTANRDYSIDRSTDIAEKLNKEDTPLQGYIKFPGSRVSKGGIQLSTVVNNLKPLVKPGGDFEKYKITTLENQFNILTNYFTVLSNFYGNDWFTTKNPFIFASGFSAAISILTNRLLPEGFAKKKFSIEFLEKLIKMSSTGLILQEEVKGMSGEAAKQKIYNRLDAYIQADTAEENDFEF
jgi:DNA sulfur modification protein DndB